MKKILILFLMFLGQMESYGNTLDPQTVEDLRINSSRNDGLLDKLGPTQTSAGRYALAKLLAEPLSNAEQISSRQEFLKDLVEKPELRENLKSLFEAFNEHEEALERFLATENERNFYWSWERLNSKAALNLYHSLPIEMATSIGHFTLNSVVLLHGFIREGKRPSITEMTCGPNCQHDHHGEHTHSSSDHEGHEHKSHSTHAHAHSCSGHSCTHHKAPVVLPYAPSCSGHGCAHHKAPIKLPHKHGRSCSGQSCNHHKAPIVLPHAPPVDLTQCHTCSKPGTSEKAHSLDHDHTHTGSTHGSHHHATSPKGHASMNLGWKVFYGVAFYVHLAEHINGVVQSYRHVIHRRNEIRSAYKELRSISQSLEAAKNIFLQVEHKNDILGEQPAQLLELFNMLPSADLLKSEEIPTYGGILQRKIGDYLVAYRQLFKSKEAFSMVNEYIGKVDAYLSIAELFASYQYHENSFTWVELASSSSFKSKGMWNPMLEPEFAVANDLSFDPQKNKLLLTGANASGKSVFASSIALNALLAQTFGIAAAKSLSLSPFDKILTHINFTDDVNQGLSTMRAELKLVGRILKQASSGDGSMLIIFDDSLFKGTSTAVGEKLAFKTFKRLASEAPEVTVVGVTHYDGLVKSVQSDKVLSSSFRLAHMAIDSEDGYLYEPTFKLEFGAPDYSSPLVLLPKDELANAFGRD